MMSEEETIAQTPAFPFCGFDHNPAAPYPWNPNEPPAIHPAEYRVLKRGGAKAFINCSFDDGSGKVEVDATDEPPFTFKVTVNAKNFSDDEDEEVVSWRRFYSSICSLSFRVKGYPKQEGAGIKLTVSNISATGFKDPSDPEAGQGGDYSEARDCKTTYFLQVQQDPMKHPNGKDDKKWEYVSDDETTDEELSEIYNSIAESHDDKIEMKYNWYRAVFDCQATIAIYGGNDDDPIPNFVVAPNEQATLTFEVTIEL